MLVGIFAKEFILFNSENKSEKKKHPKIHSAADKANSVSTGGVFLLLYTFHVPTKDKQNER